MKYSLLGRFDKRYRMKKYLFITRRCLISLDLISSKTYFLVKENGMNSKNECYRLPHLQSDNTFHIHGLARL